MSDHKDDDLAQRCADASWAGDQASRGLGMQIESVGAGRSKLTMDVAQNMVNGHGICHGGYIFLLADSTFAYACNTYDERTVAMHCTITFVAAAALGDTLIAEAHEQARFGRNGIYDVTVRKDDGTLIAEFRGNSRTIGGSILSDGVER